MNYRSSYFQILWYSKRQTSRGMKGGLKEHTRSLTRKKANIDNQAAFTNKLPPYPTHISVYPPI